MATARQNDDFASTVLNVRDLLDDAIEWIKNNLSPDDVFDASDLAAHVRANIEIDEVYSERNILDYVHGTYNPEDVFTAADLAAWAEENGYVKEE